jgi:hypothetical protein
MPTLVGKDARHEADRAMDLTGEGHESGASFQEVTGGLIDRQYRIVYYHYKD